MELERLPELKDFLLCNVKAVQEKGFRIVYGRFGDGEFSGEGFFVCRKICCLLSALLINRRFEFPETFPKLFDPFRKVDVFCEQWEFAIKQVLSEAGFSLTNKDIWALGLGFDEFKQPDSKHLSPFYVLGLEIGKELFNGA